KSLKWRYAVKSFDPKTKLSSAQLDRVKEGLQLTPTSMGLQLMKFIIIENQELKEQIVPFAFNQSQVRDCSQLIVLCRKTSVEEADILSFVERTRSVRELDEDSPTIRNYEQMLRNSLSLPQPQQETWMENQVYIALGNLMAVCAAEKIDSCPMEGFKRTELNQFLGLNKLGLNAVVLCPIGFRSPDDKYSSVSKVRREKSSLFTII
ncbi:MAG: nitroreductase family protein, partial [Brumimicrobium sp.]